MLLHINMFLKMHDQNKFPKTFFQTQHITIYN
jgi:hypothetical protein